MCLFCNVWACVFVCLVMCGCVYVFVFYCVGECICGLFNVRVFLRVCFIMCGFAYVWVL